MSNILLLSENDIPKLSAVSGNIDIDNMTPYIKMAQDTQLKRMLTINLYNKIVADYENDKLKGEYLFIYNNFIVDFLVYYSAMNIVLFNSFKITNSGVHQLEAKNASVLEMKDIEKVANRYRQLGASVELTFNEYMRTSKIKEYRDGNGCNGNSKPSYQFPWY